MYLCSSLVTSGPSILRFWDLETRIFGRVLPFSFVRVCGSSRTIQVQVESCTAIHILCRTHWLFSSIAAWIAAADLFEHNRLALCPMDRCRALGLRQDTHRQKSGNVMRLIITCRMYVYLMYMCESYCKSKTGDWWIGLNWQVLLVHSHFLSAWIG